jgi:hypothetical protein
MHISSIELEGTSWLASIHKSQRAVGDIAYILEPCYVLSYTLEPHPAPVLKPFTAGASPWSHLGEWWENRWVLASC